MLCVGVETHSSYPKVAVEDVPTPEDRIWIAREIDALALDIDRRLEPGCHSELLNLLSHPPDHVLCGGLSGMMTEFENASPMMVWTISIIFL
jgi:hypothetical protein